MTDRPRRPVLRANLDPVEEGPVQVPDAELLERLESRLAVLPAQERVAAMVAIGYGEGLDGVMEQLNLSPEDAFALTESAVQLLRGAFGDVGPEQV